MIIDCHSHSNLSADAIINIDSLNFDSKPPYRYSIGLHPWRIDSSADTTIETLKGIIESNSNIIAIGECGIDNLADADIATQERIFESHIELSESFSLPLIIHCVRAWQNIIHLHKIHQPSQPWIIHGFRGKPSVLSSLLAEDFYISFGERFNENSLKLTPLDRLLIETDESALSIYEIADRIASVLDLSTDNLIAIVKANNARCFAIK